MEAVTKREDRLLAALCHISIIFSTMGLIFPIVIYVNARERSKPLAFQAMQAILYHVASIIWITVYAIIWTIIFVAFTGIFTAAAEPAAGPGGEMAGATMIVFTVLIIIFVLSLFGGIFIVYVLGIAGTVQTMRARMFRYPVIGRWLERWLVKDKE